ncbi:MAG TPA: HNH endonuclease signature motif containing protein [Bacillota bacterium]|jgi:hypothetical protein
MLDRARKILWARSGNRCAVCRSELVIDATPKEPDTVVGDECHIVSAKGRGPRYDPSFPPELLDEPENLVLLCRVHHKMVDDQPQTYTSEYLRRTKSEHEKWVSSVLAGSKQPPVRLRLVKDSAAIRLVRLTTGQELVSIIGDSYAFSFDYDEPMSNDEMELISEFLQAAQDWGDIWDELEAGARVKVAFEMGQTIQELDRAGFWVFGGREVQRLEGGVGSPSPWPVAILRVVRSTNPETVEEHRQTET